MTIQAMRIPTTDGPWTAFTVIVPSVREEHLREVISGALAMSPNADDQIPVEFTPPYGRNYGPKDAWSLPEIQPSDAEGLRWALADLTPEQLAVAKLLVEADGEYVSTGELLRRAGYPNDAKASGVFRSINGRLRAIGRKPFWDGKRSEGDGRLLAVTRDGVADLLRQVIADLE